MSHSRMGAAFICVSSSIELNFPDLNFDSSYILSCIIFHALAFIPLFLDARTRQQYHAMLH